MEPVNESPAVAKPGTVTPTEASAPPKKTTRREPAAPKADGAVTLAPLDILAEDELATTTYWLGVLPVSKIEVIHIGGVAFHKKTGVPHRDESSGVTSYTDSPGQVLELTDAQVDRIKADVLQKVVRRIGGRWRLLNRNGKTYRAQGGDESVARYLYMHDLSQTGGRPPVAPRAMME